MCVSLISAYWHGCHSLIRSLHATAQALKLPPSQPWEQVQSPAGLSLLQRTNSTFLLLITAGLSPQAQHLLLLASLVCLDWEVPPVRLDPLSVNRTYPQSDDSSIACVWSA